LDILIRAMRDDDLEQVVALERECHRHPWSKDLFRQELANPVAQIELIFVGAVLAGFLCTWRVADELEIQNVVTSTSYRRQGLAERLIEQALLRARADGARRSLLEVRSGNAPARRLYHKLGFVESGLRRGYYPDGEDAVLMSCELG